MNILSYLQQNKDRWWALPLLLPVIFLPLLNVASTYTQLNGGSIVLYYMPLSFLLSAMLFFGLAALPGIILALFLRYYDTVSLYETVA
ncbi:sensor domain-containing phosphodiesterase, partial [Enterobacter sp. RIT637]|nr:sensor domain-containing phosphodiesterase [Enterobacter sp. RIT637]